MSKHPTSLAYLFICLIYSTQANATDVNQPMLNEANLLVESSPETSLEVAERFIAQRELSELNQLPVRGHDSMSNPQSLLDTIQAYMITARAQCALENKAEAWEALAKARFWLKKMD